MQRFLEDAIDGLKKVEAGVLHDEGCIVLRSIGKVGKDPDCLKLYNEIWLIATKLTFIDRVSSSLFVSKVKTCAITFRIAVCPSSSVIGRGSSVSSWFCEEFARRRLMEVRSTSCWTAVRFGSYISFSSRAEIVVNYTWIKTNLHLL
jgi:hypothetical protein